MINSHISRCVWLVDTLRRFGSLTLRQINELWENTLLYDEQSISRKTMSKYRELIQDVFDINIAYDPSTYEYRIAEENVFAKSVSSWLLDSLSINGALAGAADIANRIFLEDIPSARTHLGSFIDAIRQNRRIRLDYHPFTRLYPNKNIEIEPYLLKLFKQRWYVVSRNVDENRIKTYALDRMSKVQILDQTFDKEIPIDPATYFDGAYGIVVGHNEVKKVVLKVSPRQAKYFAALPLHSSQTQMMSDKFSLFTYHLRITDDFVSELLSYGDAIEVLEPHELRIRIKHELLSALSPYTASDM